jgi:hypothetical protein
MVDIRHSLERTGSEKQSNNMEKVLREYKKAHKAMRRLGRVIRKEQARGDVRLARAREATIRAKADSAAYATRMQEVLDAQAKTIAEVTDGSSDGLDSDEGLRVASEILGVFPECATTGCDKGANKWHCDFSGCTEPICDDCWNMGVRFCEAHQDAGKCACGHDTLDTCDMTGCDAPVCTTCRDGGRRFCPPHALEAKG